MVEIERKKELALNWYNKHKDDPEFKAKKAFWQRNYRATQPERFTLNMARHYLRKLTQKQLSELLIEIIKETEKSETGGRVEKKMS